MKSGSVKVTGATGLVGWHVADAFRDAGWRVGAIVRPGSPNPLPSGVDRIDARLQEAELAAACAGADVIVHSAALLRSARRQAFDAINVEGTRAVVAAANACGARLVYISSQAAIGPSPADRASEEDDPPRPLTAYGRSKREAEAVVRREARVPWTILRPASVYGPRDRQFLALFRLAARGRFLLATRAGASFTLVHVADVARAVLLAACSPAAEHSAFFVGHPQPATAAGILEAIADAVGRPYHPRAIPAAVLPIAAAAGEIAWRFGRTPMFDRARLAEFRAGTFVCSVARARERFGFVAEIPLGEGMASTWRWYRENGWA